MLIRGLTYHAYRCPVHSSTFTSFLLSEIKTGFRYSIGLFNVRLILVYYHGNKMKILFNTVIVTLALTSLANAERKPTILDLVEKGYEIKSSTGNYVFLQNEQNIYICSFLQVSEYNVASGEIDAIKFDCAAVK